MGKGRGRRAYNSYIGHRPPKNRSRIVIMNRSNEAEAFVTEIELIRNWGRKDLGTGILYNRTDGGDGASGFISSEERNQKIRESKQGKNRPTFSKEWRENLSKAAMGNQHLLGKTWALSAEARRHHSEALKGKLKTGAALIAAQANGKLGGGHARWHSSKGIVNPNCELCMKDQG